MAVAGPLGVMAVPAGADPANAKKGEVLEIVCEENDMSETAGSVKTVSA
jgi:hypothetical protein